MTWQTIDAPLPFKNCVRLKVLGLLPTEANLPIFTYRHGMVNDSPTTAYFSEEMLARIDWLKETWAPTPLTALAWFEEVKGIRFERHWVFGRHRWQAFDASWPDRGGLVTHLLAEAETHAELVEKILDAIGVK